MNAVYRISESSATFEHGNLPRGVCPVAEFSQTLIGALENVLPTNFTYRMRPWCYFCAFDWSGSRDT